MDWAALHPQVVHFTIVLVIIGVAFRLVSLLKWPAFAFTSPAAATLLILAALAGVISARTGTAAHEPVERAPGARPAVVEHEEWGERTQIVLLILGAIELLGLALTRSPTSARMVHMLSAAVGLVGVIVVYETAAHGGELVYSYAGGVGIRSGDPKDVERLLLAGYYQQSLVDRKAGRADLAAALMTAAVQRFPTDPEVRMLAAESMLLDQKNPQAAIDALAALEVPQDNRVMRTQRAMLLADAFEAAGRKDAAIAALEPVQAAFPNPRIQARIENLKK